MQKNQKQQPLASTTLSAPNFEKVVQWDSRLEQLQNEVKALEQEYGFAEEHIELYQKEMKGSTNEKSATKPPRSTQKNNRSALLNSSKQSRENRYSNLPKIEQKPVPQPSLKTKPEIDPEWRKANNTKPDQMAFFDKDTYQPTHINNKDFETKPAFYSDYTYFYDYMSTFASKHTKQVKV